MEGDRCYNPSSNCNRSNLTLPIYQYTHAEGNSITGGIVYRGAQLTEIRGHYFFADYGARWVRSFRYNNGQLSDIKEWDLGSLGNVTSFGEDGSGEMYLTASNGTVSKFVKE
jgi:hypothetical protein